MFSSNNKLKLLIGSALVGFFASSSNTLAGGYQLNEYSATNLGRSFAGAGVVGDDYSAIAFNPAGMVLKGTGVQIGATMVNLRSDAKGSLTTPTGTLIKDSPRGKVRLITTLPHGFAQYKYSNDLTFGMGIYTPFGLSTSYNKDWYAAVQGTHTELDIFDMAFGGAYRITPKITLGGTVIARYVYGNLRNNLSTTSTAPENEMKLDGWDCGFHIGLMYEPIKDLRLGVSYRFNGDHTVTGHQTISNAGPLSGKWDAESTMTLPNQLSITGYYKINDKWGVSGLARWTQWDVFDDFIMTSKRSGGSTYNTPEKWGNAWTLALGADYYFSPSWTFRIGTSYDETGVQSQKYRTVRIPDSDRYWVSLGVSYKYKSFTFDVGYAHLFMKESKSNNFDASTGTVAHARYHGFGNMLGGQIQYNF